MWSAILYSHLTESDVYLVTAEEQSCCGKGCKYQAISSCFGWWGLFGIFYTLYALIFNCTAHVDRTNFTLARLHKRQAATHAPSAVTAPLRVEGEKSLYSKLTLFKFKLSDTVSGVRLYLKRGVLL